MKKTKTNGAKKRSLLAIALITVLVFSTVSCTGSGGKTLNSAEALKEYLDKQPANTPDKPIRVTMNANAPMLPNIAAAINSAGKYVSLNLSGDALTVIPELSFADCDMLVSINIPKSVTSIGSRPFYYCSSLTSVTIPSSVTSIGVRAFEGCTSLTSVTIPVSVTSIDIWAFQDCTNLISVKFEGNITSGNFHENTPFPGDLRAKYLAGGIGTYTRPSGKSDTWTKQ
jgi:hypothetical protein